MSDALPRVLFVDDEERILRSLRMLFRGRAEILATTSGREAVELVRSHRVHVVVSDQRMPGMTGVDVLREVAACSPPTMRILLTGYADLDAMTASVNEGEIYRFVEKPWDAQRLIATVEQAARIAMDEFGTGPSWPGNLKAFPFDKIRIDRSFVAAMRGNPDAQAIVVAIVRLGESLAMPITAEGVEDEVTAIELTRLGCAKGQGWYYGRAASAEDTARLLADRGLLRAPMVPAPPPASDDEPLRKTA